jgi:hypothetical protein
LNLTFPIISAMTGMAELGNTDYMTGTSVVAALPSPRCRQGTVS